MEEAPDEGAGTLQVFVRPETPLINRPRLPVRVPQTGVEGLDSIALVKIINLFICVTQCLES